MPTIVTTVLYKAVCKAQRIFSITLIIKLFINLFNRYNLVFLRDQVNKDFLSKIIRANFTKNSGFFSNIREGKVGIVTLYFFNFFSILERANLV